MTRAPEGQGLVVAIKMAIKPSGMDRTDINYANALRTLTAYNDEFEKMSFKLVFEVHATKKDGMFAVSST